MAKRYISQLAHVEIITPKLEESAAFWKDLVGMEESGRQDGSIYLRCWGEYFYSSLVLTEGDQPALGHIGWRAAGSEELDAAVQAIEAAGGGEGWHEGSLGHGRAYRFRGPGGHRHELFWEVARYQPPAP